MKKTVVVHSGGMDSSICLALAIKEFGIDQVLSLSFDYGQRHRQELIQAAKICGEWQVEHLILDVTCLGKITHNALIDSSLKIEHRNRSETPNTFVIGRNGLFARLAGMYAHQIGAGSIYMGVIEVESANSNYPDCTRAYMKLKQEILRIDLQNPHFEIRTPLIEMTKKETLQIASQLNVLDYLMTETITCYEGIFGTGCQECPACLLRNEGVRQFYAESNQILQ